MCEYKSKIIAWVSKERKLRAIEALMPISIELYHDYYTREKVDAYAINFSTTFEKINYFFDQFQCFWYFDRKSIIISMVHNL